MDRYFWSADGLQLLTSDFFKRCMVHVFERAVGIRLVPSKWRQMAVAIDRHYLQSFGSRKTGAEADEGEPEDTAHHAQAAHTARLANRFYGKDSRYGSNVRVVSLNDFQLVSWAWAREAGLGPDPLLPHPLQRLPPGLPLPTGPAVVSGAPPQTRHGLL